MVDILTKFDQFFAIESTFTASQVVELFFRDVFRLHGLPKNIVSDRDSMFISVFWKENFNLVGTQLNPSTIYHPQTNGQTENVNQWLEGYLETMRVGNKKHGLDGYIWVSYTTILHFISPIACIL